MTAESIPLYRAKSIMKDFTCNTILLNDFLGYMEGIQVNFGFTSMLSFILNNHLGGINGLDYTGSNTA
jgi:hypothetical protein